LKNARLLRYAHPLVTETYPQRCHSRGNALVGPHRSEDATRALHLGTFDWLG
jgi:hypothetical protein